MTELGWGDQLVVVPANTGHFETNVPVSYLGTNFEVQIEAGLRAASGQAYAIFRSIDPTTGLPPAVNIGFLPPENGTGRGMGHVSYTIRARTNLVTGTQIRNVAQISFDNQPPIATNQRDPHNPAAGTDPAKECLNTIDVVAPTSQVLPLGDTNRQTQFLVQWTGQDDAGGSGVATYDVLVSDNGGPWVLWTNTAATSAVYRGLDNRAYAFYSVARDQAGLVETAPALADAVTRVAATPDLSQDLFPTYNLVSVPFSGTGWTNAEALASAIPNCAGVWKWDASVQGWSGHRPGGPNNFAVSGGQSFMAAVTGSGRFTVTGPWTTAPQPLRAGYNLVVLSLAHQDLNDAEGLARCIPNCSGLWKWDPASQGWSGHRPDGPNNFGVELGRAYLIYVTADATW